LHTLGSLILALQVQEGAAPVSATSGGVIDILKGTGPLNQAVFAILILFSIVSWAIILSKTFAFQKVKRQTGTFLDVFRRSQKFSEVQAVCPSLPSSPLVGVFQAGYAELNAQFRLTGASGGTPNPAAAAQRPILKSLDAVDRALIRAATAEVNKLERHLTFLATTASITPFIGLLLAAALPRWLCVGVLAVQV